MTSKRRTFIKQMALLTSGVTAAVVGKKYFFPPEMKPMEPLFMPDESHPHQRTWMAFVANEAIWSQRQIPAVKRELILIAQTIAKYEPISMLVGPRDFAEAEQRLRLINSPFPIELVEFATDDLWLRDIGPTFVHNAAGETVAIDFNFNGWGNKQAHRRDARVAQFIAQQTGDRLINTDLVLEGGCFEVDGKGTAILTKSAVLNPNRNPGLNQADVESRLRSLLGLRHIIWLEGIAGEDITDGHIDFYARFSRPGHVVVSRDNDPESYDYDITRENIQILRSAVDADGKPLELSVIDTPEIINERYGFEDVAAGYIGYYVCNNAVIAQKFGDPEADERARRTLAEAFPERRIEQLAIDGIASGGGSIHCATQQEISI